MNFGKLYLIPVPLSENSEYASFTPYARELINGVDEFIVENEKTARRFLKQAGLTRPQEQLIIRRYGKHERAQASSSQLLQAALDGRHIGLMSESGCPGIADPGAEIVAEAHRLGIQVVPLVGPSSILLGLMASGFNGQRFTFHGYLPIGKAERSSKIKQLERASSTNHETQIFIETPFRNSQLLEELLRTLNPETLLCVGVDLTAASEEIYRLPVAGWRRLQNDQRIGTKLHKRPAIFLVFASRT